MDVNSSIDISSTKLSLIDCGITSLYNIPLQSQLITIVLHSNCISRLENLHRLTFLRHLDVSSNQITKIEGLQMLQCLRTLNLSCNLISSIEGLSELRSLTKINLSFNQIDDAGLSGFKSICGPEYKLSHVTLHGNKISSVVLLAGSFVKCLNLKTLILCYDSATNPVCQKKGYRGEVLSRLLQVNSLDGRDRHGQLVTVDDSVVDIPGLEDLLNFGALTSTTVHSSDQSPVEDFNKKSFSDENALVHSARLTAEKDIIEDSEDSAQIEVPIKNLNRRSPKVRARNYQKQTVASKSKKKIPPKYETSSSTEEVELENDISVNEGKVSSISGQSYNLKSAIPVSVKSINCDQKDRRDVASTYIHIVKELEQERERRWKSEQATRKLADYIKELQEKAKETSSIKNTAVEATSYLKNALMSEKETKGKLKEQNEEMQEEVRKLTDELNKMKQTEIIHKEAIKKMDETLTHQERNMLTKEAHTDKRYQDLQVKHSAINQELHIIQQSHEKQKGQIQQLQELLANREQEHREELKRRFTLDSPQLQGVIEKQLQNKEKEYRTELKSCQEKIDLLSQQYSDLEDEFRMALQIEASRFQQVQEAFERICEENAGNKKELVGALKKDEKASVMLKELSLLVKEQKGRIAELSKSKQEQSIEYKERVQTLEAHIEEAKKRMVQFEVLKKEKGKLVAEIEAQQSIIDGLRAERKLWGQELAQQGSSLAQDRGRLEAKIETLQYELNTMKKNVDRETDIVKIKTKMIDDQTETIKKLKDGLLERDVEIKNVREEALKTQKTLEEQLAEEKVMNQDNQELIDSLQERKVELKDEISTLQLELEEEKNSGSHLNKKLKEKSNLIVDLEQRVKLIEQTWKQKEQKLTDERDKAVETATKAVEKLKSVDDTFRQQIEAKDKSYQDHISQLEASKNKEIEEANRRVFVVEEEMRDLLRENEANKRGMENKIKRMTKALGELQSDLL